MNSFEKFSRQKLGISSLKLDNYKKHYIHNNMTPYVIEERKLNAVSMDVFSRLMMDRILFVGYPIDEESANIIMAQLLFLENQNPNQDIKIYFNCPGGDISSGLGIYDVMNHIDCDIVTVCSGIAASMAAVLLSAGTPGKRFILPNSKVMIHQAWGGTEGSTKDMEIFLQLIKSEQDTIYKILSKNTGKSVEEIERDSDRDYWMSSQESLEYGIVDEILQ